ncbi:MAG: helix-turn-helix transcriptional regulator [Bacteroidota bacterium]|nr:helix-turn-helix transcriptional regulator [Bacteroidota bacterium]
MSKQEIQKRFRELSAIRSSDEYFEIEAMMLHFRVMQLVEQSMEKKGWNKKQLAEKLQKSKSYITQLFTGSKMVNMPMMARLQEVLDISFKLETKSKDERCISWKYVNSLPSENENFKSKPVTTDVYAGEYFMKKSKEAKAA